MQNKINTINSILLHHIYVARNIKKDSKEIEFLLSLNDTFQRALGKDLDDQEIVKLCDQIQKLI